MASEPLNRYPTTWDEYHREFPSPVDKMREMQVALGKQQDYVADLERRLAGAEAKYADLRDWAKVANQFAWAHEPDCPRRKKRAACNCGLDAFLSRPRPVIESFRQQIAEAEAAHAADRALLRKALEALATCAIPLEVIGHSIVEDGIYTEMSEELQQVIVDEVIPKMRAVISSPEAKRAMEEQR